MSRAGPRPYGCVRRIWHSDRHLPIRGTLIQEILRIASELHSPATRRNREWQEKLPIVVLKAEEIMYSKANSEGEYSDLKTLWDRVNDAINTIIRREESAETGELLQPCIEAALHLGCTPTRSSRSQRNISPRYYLRPERPEATTIPLSNTNAKFYGNHAANNPLMPMNSLCSFLQPDDRSIQNRYDNYKKFPVLLKNFAPSDDHHASVQTYASSNRCSVYPLYCIDQVQLDDPQFYSTKPSNSASHLMESDELSVPQILSPCILDASDFVAPSNNKDSSDEGHGMMCDLTLRLAP